MRTGRWIVTLVVALGLASAAFALTGKNGWTASTVTTAADVKANSGYLSDFGGVQWDTLGTVEFWSINSSQRSGLAVDGSGNMYTMVWGYDYVSGMSGPFYYGLIRVEGSTITTLVQDSGDSVSGGSQLQRVVVSPSTIGGLTKGHPVVIRWVDDVSAHGPAGDYSIVSVDPDNGTETLIYTLYDRTTGIGVFEIDGSGTGTDGTIYLGNGTAITRLTWSGSDWVEDSLSGAGHLLVGPDGMLYTSGQGWGVVTSKMSDHPIYRTDPATGATSVWGYVERSSSIYSWNFDANGTLWFGLHSTTRKQAKNPNYIASGVAGGVTNINNRISESAGYPYYLAGDSNAVYVMENFATINALE